MRSIYWIGQYLPRTVSEGEHLQMTARKGSRVDFLLVLNIGTPPGEEPRGLVPQRRPKHKRQLLELATGHAADSTKFSRDYPDFNALVVAIGTSYA